MLRRVVEDYLGAIHRERDYDFLFMSLLSDLGFYDIHFTHGTVEFGKDFIAKLNEDEQPVQFAFQSKAGNVNITAWRSIVGQLNEAMLVPLSHPNFDAHLPRQIVLVSNGELQGIAKTSFDNYQTEQKRLGHRPPIFWGKSQLADRLINSGVNSIHRATEQGYRHLSSFFSLYSEAIRKTVTSRQIERYSQLWFDASVPWNTRVLICASEAEIIATACERNGLLYEAITMHIAALRFLMYSLHQEEGPQDTLQDMLGQSLRRIEQACLRYVNSFEHAWRDSEEGLISLLQGFGSFATYLVHCSRFLEILGLLYFMTDDAVVSTNCLSVIVEFSNGEEGAFKIIGERDTISILLPLLALTVEGKLTDAAQRLVKATIWYCDRHEHGKGLAQFDATEDREVYTLIGHSLQRVNYSKGFTACALSDLAAFMDEPLLYQQVVNEIKAVMVAPAYYLPQDSAEVYFVGATDLTTIPNVHYADTISTFTNYEFANHIQYEPKSFYLEPIVGCRGFMCLAVLLRDRYFPTLWPKLTRNN